MKRFLILLCLLPISLVAQDFVEGDTIAVRRITTPNFTAVLPNVFTPNGDNINDTYTITTSDNVTKVELFLYNRWGSLVYQSDDYQNDYSPLDLADGVYFVTAIIHCGTFNMIKNETITLLRNEN